MAELRTTEAKVKELANLYTSLRRDLLLTISDKRLADILTPLPVSWSDPNDPANNGIDRDNGPPTDDDNNSSPLDHDVSNNSSHTNPTSYTTVLNEWQDLIRQLDALQAVAAKFQKRLGDKDPITAKPRYGSATAARVQGLLTLYQHMVTAVAAMTTTTDDDENDDNLLQPLYKGAQMQQQQQQQALLEHQARVAKEQAERKQAFEQEQERKRLEAAAAAAAVQQQEEARIREAQAARAHARALQQQAAAADRAWMASISKGADSVREQLNILMDATSGEEQKTAVTALHTIFRQICAHPEEVQFRRIRRDHARFEQDIGRHKGGKELLIAAGFRLGAIDDVPSYISTEPDIEKDMDGWAAWFDLNKATLAILEEHL